MQTLVAFPGAVTPGMTMLGGDSATIRADGQRWRVAAMSTAAAAADVGAVALVDGFLGTEADTWTHRVRVDTAELLGHLATARDIVGGALVRYAEVLEQCQRELRRLEMDRLEMEQTELRRPATPGGPRDSAPPGLLVVALRASAARRRHDEAQWNCAVEIDRAIALAPGSIPGVRPGVAAPAVLDLMATRRSSTVVTVGAGLSIAARMSTQVPHPLAAPAPPDDDGEFLDPQTKAIYREKFYQRCLAEQQILGNVASTAGISAEAGCGAWADSVVATRENLIHAATAKPGTIEPLPEMPRSGLLGASEMLLTFLFAGCMEGSVGGCLFDVGSTFFPFGKLGKIGKDVAEALEHADDAVDAAKGARAAGHSDDAAAAKKADEPAPREKPAGPPERPPDRAPDENAGRPSEQPKGSGTFGPFDRGQLIAAAGAPDRNGLTRAGRALQKHGDREVQKKRGGAPSAFLGMSSGTAAERNEQGLRVVREIIDDPEGSVFVGHSVVEVTDRTGRRVRFLKDGTFDALLEPVG